MPNQEWLVGALLLLMVLFSVIVKSHMAHARTPKVLERRTDFDDLAGTANYMTLYLTPNIIFHIGPYGPDQSVGVKIVVQIEGRLTGDFTIVAVYEEKVRQLLVEQRDTMPDEESIEQWRVIANQAVIRWGETMLA